MDRRELSAWGARRWANSTPRRFRGISAARSARCWARATTFAPRERIILNRQQLNRADRRALRREIREQGLQSEFRYV